MVSVSVYFIDSPCIIVGWEALWLYAKILKATDTIVGGGEEPIHY